MLSWALQIDSHNLGTTDKARYKMNLTIKSFWTFSSFLFWGGGGGKWSVFVSREDAVTPRRKGRGVRNTPNLSFLELLLPFAWSKVQRNPRAKVFNVFVHKYTIEILLLWLEVGYFVFGNLEVLQFVHLHSYFSFYVNSLKVGLETQPKEVNYTNDLPLLKNWLNTQKTERILF